MRSKKSFYISWITAVVFCILAFVLLSIGWTGYGLSIFCVLPIALGIATGIIPDRRGAIVGLIFAMACFFFGLLAMGLEGVVCLLMAIPVITPFIFAGYLVAYLIQRFRQRKHPKLYISFLPFLLFISTAAVENVMGDEQIKQAVTTSIIVPYTSEEVYDEIIHVDTVSAEKGVFHYLGLPTPLSCTLTEEKVGGLRICEFEDGQIIETITAFKRGKYLKMDVTQFDLEGRSWLRFDEDIYEMEKVEGGTKVSRTTTYFSELKPRFYWSKIEALTIREEQDLVFRNLLLDLEKSE